MHNYPVMPHKPLPTDDLLHILHHARPSFETLRNANLFITGGTGFFGHWLLESLLHANRELNLKLRATVLTRNAAAFRANSPHITSDPAITLLEGDIATFVFPTEPHTHIIHAATDSGGKQAAQTPEALAASILAGTKHVLDFARATGASRLLYTSTGAVYGRSTQLLHTPETYPIPTLPPYSYESAKLAAEATCLAYADLNPVIARCFAFVGPHLPLDAHFAIGNFIGAAIEGRPIHIRGDGTPRRSWLYMSDLATWLWTLLTHGQPGRAYNVGSDDGMTIAEAAQLTAATLPFDFPFRTLRLPKGEEPASPFDFPFRTLSLPKGEEPASRDRQSVPIQIDGTPNPTAPLNSYVPDITRARTELGLQVTVPLPKALLRTAAWHQDH